MTILEARLPNSTKKHHTCLTSKPRDSEVELPGVYSAADKAVDSLV